MTSTTIHGMNPLFSDFSAEARRLPLPLCGWNKPCHQGFGEYQNLLVINGLPKVVRLCKKHDEMINEFQELHGETIESLEDIIEAFRGLFGLANAAAQDSTEQQESEETPSETQLVVAPAPGEPHAEQAPLKDIALPVEPAQNNAEKMAEDTRKVLEELRRDFPDASIPDVEPRPSEEHFLCGMLRSDGKLCAEWVNLGDNNQPQAHAKRHHTTTYQIRLYPTLKVVCKDSDHTLAGCVRSFRSEESWRQHKIHTKLKPQARVPEQASPDALPLEDADHATT